MLQKGRQLKEGTPTNKKNINEDYFGEYIPQLIGEKIAEYIEAPKTLSLVIAVTYIVSISISCFFLNSVMKSNDEEVLKLITADVHDTIRREITQSMMVSRTMATDSFLKQNLRQEINISRDTEAALMQDYLSGIKKNFNYDIAFVISAASRNYYYDGGFNKVIDPEGNPYDFWYKNFLESNLPYGVEIDFDEFDKNAWTVFINTRVEDNDGKLLGICGIGLAMTDFQNILQDKEKLHKVKIDIFQPEENFNIDTGAVKFKDPHLKEIFEQLQAQADLRTQEFVIGEIENVFVVAKYIKEFNSCLLIRRDNAYVQGIFSDLVIRILIYSGVVLFVLIIFVQVNVGKEHKKVKEESKRQGLTSHADKFAVMYLIDLKYGTAQEVSRHEGFKLLQIRDGGNAGRKIRNSLLTTTKYETLRGLLEFVNLDDLSRRLNGKRALSYEFLSKEYGWCRANFIILDNTSDTQNQIVFGIEVIDAEKRRAEELKRKSETDLMTGLRNRGSGEKTIADLMAHKVPGMFCLMDADKFKSINDTYGHGVGDKVIIAIANALKKTFRNNDVVMRLGGDEYAVFAAGVVDEERGKMIIKRLFREIDDIYIAELAGKRKIEISLGAAIYDGVEDISFSEIYKRADSGTYKSKKIQGNACTFFKKGENLQ